MKKLITLYDDRLVELLELRYRQNRCQECPVFDKCNSKHLCVEFHHGAGYTKPINKRACFKEQRAWLQKSAL